MFEGILGGASTSSQSPQLGIGKDPRVVGGTAKTRIKSLMTLPNEVSGSTVIAEAKESGRMDAEVTQLQAVYGYRKNQLDQAVKGHEIHANYASDVMNADARLQSIDSRHAIKASSHTLTSGENAAYTNGYIKQMEFADSVIDI